MEQRMEDMTPQNNPCGLVEVIINCTEYEEFSQAELDRVIAPLAAHIQNCDHCQLNIQISAEFLSYLCDAMQNRKFPFSREN
jgi:hypothetical protein